MEEQRRQIGARNQVNRQALLEFHNLTEKGWRHQA